jgi:predicted transcriptional regulator
VTTTTVRLGDELKSRIAAVVSSRGDSSHAFIIGAIERQVAEAEGDLEFERLASARWQQVLKTGKTVPLADAQAWIAARARGSQAPRPKARASR